ncbi:hypothetical protein [Acinetobacter pullicarnis]|uniref:hypothetical protein n=1 Tax=Acinetobacter pullicarnis TaxID=2576829 RepID=UPI00111E266F|nr:hypothetical protein [Acinetobacter pullicarnis]
MKKINVNVFFQFGPLIGTAIILLAFLLLNFFSASFNFADQSLLVEHVIGMLLFSCIAVVVGYIVGSIPALITQRIFLNILMYFPKQRKYHHFIKAGFYASLIWFIPALFIYFFYRDTLVPLALAVVLCSMTSMICAHLSWKYTQIRPDTEATL